MVKLTHGQQLLLKNQDDYIKNRCDHIIRTLTGDFAQFPEVKSRLAILLDGIIHDTRIVEIYNRLEKIRQSGEQRG